ncbi:putative glycerol kinase 5-like protein [Dinothrombium tinctorium]|uniref:glycerol kinase n=1 Tax=Dinothrombium tinctorium TaxID=1965070 RepID=A0A3S3RW21_9ACAR|nr:putative glycerol kinase 5-like protein [Dinothrombium tinctorium]
MSDVNNFVDEQFILALDIGTTNIRAHVYNKFASIVGEASESIEIISNEPGCAEIDPDSLWNSVLKVCHNSVKRMVVMRLLWILQNYIDIRKIAFDGKALYGTMDTWLVWKFTGGAVHATDPSNASTSGLFDPFELKWSPIIFSLFAIPESILPEVRDTNGDFGSTLPSLFDISIPIKTVIADQPAATFGECCFSIGDLKCTLGTGSFINLNTGHSPHSSFKGLYPVIGWKLRGEKAVYLVEGSAFDTGTAINWAQKIHLFNDVAESSAIAELAQNSGGVYFVPAFSGLQAPFNDPNAISSFFGISSSVEKPQLLRALLESIAFRAKQIYEIMIEECDVPPKNFRVNGGVASNDFIVQLIADLTECEIQRSNHREMSSLGAAFLAGLSCGFWKDTKELEALLQYQTIFKPRNNWVSKYKNIVKNWERAVKRTMHWFPEN